MDKFCQDRGLKLTALPGIFIAPIALYSKKIKDVKELKKGDTITIPNDPTNGGRALQLLAGADLLKLKEGVGHAATVEDIIDNPLRLRIMEVKQLLCRERSMMPARRDNPNLCTAGRS